MDNVNGYIFGDSYIALLDNSTLCIADLDNILLKYSSASSTTSLILLCCVQVIRHIKFCAGDCVYLPSNLYKNLMMEAIREDLLDTALFLISSWPYKTISMREVFPYFLSMFAQAISERYPGNEFHDKVHKAMLCFSRICLKVLRTGLTPNLRVLDLSGWIFGDFATKLIIREIVSISKDVELLNDYHMIIGCQIIEPCTYTELIEFLKTTSKLKNVKINLHIKKLDVSFLKRDKIWKLYQLIDPTELICLCMPNYSTDFMTMVFARFSSLIALRIIEPEYPPLRQMLPLHLLPNLRRFGFISYGTGIHLYLPTSTLSKLEFLNIQDYLRPNIIGDDLRHLASVPLRLRELNMSDRAVITEHLQLWRTLLLSVASTLTVLILENCINQENHFAPIVSFILIPLADLVILDLAGNTISVTSMYEDVLKLRSMPRLKQIALPYPTRDSLMTFSYEDFEERMARKKLPAIQIDWY